MKWYRPDDRASVEIHDDKSARLVDVTQSPAHCPLAFKVAPERADPNCERIEPSTRRIDSGSRKGIPGGELEGREPPAIVWSAFGADTDFSGGFCSRGQFGESCLCSGHQFGLAWELSDDTFVCARSVRKLVGSHPEYSNAELCPGGQAAIALRVVNDLSVELDRFGQIPIAIVEHSRSFEHRAGTRLSENNSSDKQDCRNAFDNAELL